MILFFFASGRDIDYDVSSPYNQLTGPTGLTSEDASGWDESTHAEREIPSGQ